jgi:hypothetical protein
MWSEKYGISLRLVDKGLDVPTTKAAFTAMIDRQNESAAALSVKRNNKFLTPSRSKVMWKVK